MTTGTGCRRGQAMVEYVLLVALFAVVVAGAMRLFGAAWRTKFAKVEATRSGVIGMAP